MTRKPENYQNECEGCGQPLRAHCFLQTSIVKLVQIVCAMPPETHYAAAVALAEIWADHMRSRLAEHDIPEDLREGVCAELLQRWVPQLEKAQ